MRGDCSPKTDVFKETSHRAPTFPEDNNVGTEPSCPLRHQQRELCFQTCPVCLASISPHCVLVGSALMTPNQNKHGRAVGAALDCISPEPEGSSQWVPGAAQSPPGVQVLSVLGPRYLRELKWMICWLMACDQK